jgi:hypothetical protein
MRSCSAGQRSSRNGALSASIELASTGKIFDSHIPAKSVLASSFRAVIVRSLGEPSSRVKTAELQIACLEKGDQTRKTLLIYFNEIGNLFLEVTLTTIGRGGRANYLTRVGQQKFEKRRVRMIARNDSLPG